jgi:hypothetical protein
MLDQGTGHGLCRQALCIGAHAPVAPAGHHLLRTAGTGHAYPPTASRTPGPSLNAGRWRPAGSHWLAFASTHCQVPGARTAPFPPVPTALYHISRRACGWGKWLGAVHGRRRGAQRRQTTSSCPARRGGAGGGRWVAQLRGPRVVLAIQHTQHKLLPSRYGLVIAQASH